ncbi:MAG TPA: triose-phosphate isomerase [Candidatus Limnocylindria bacterium]|nr:triose-phosphate isomerase [Candidatus Limnocylindria bacterium]
MPARTPVVAGNWKMNPTSRAAALALARDCAAIADRVRDAIAIVCPPTIYLPDIAAAVGDTRLRVGAQTMAAEERGAFTGETSPLMLDGVAEFVIIGHSERRRYDGETDESVARKVASAIAHGLRPIAAIGERLEERHAGHTHAVCARQLRAAISRVDGLAGSGLVIAYEPVWAIGTGEAASPDDAQAVAAQIRAVLAEQDPAAAEDVPILYGGSVTDDNALDFFNCPDVDGALVGGASLDPAAFGRIVAAAAASTT